MSASKNKMIMSSQRKITNAVIYRQYSALIKTGTLEMRLRCTYDAGIKTDRQIG